MLVVALEALALGPAVVVQRQLLVADTEASHKEGMWVLSGVAVKPVYRRVSATTTYCIEDDASQPRSQKEGNGISTRFYALSDNRAFARTSVNGFIIRIRSRVRASSSKKLLTPSTAGSSCTFLRC